MPERIELHLRIPLHPRLFSLLVKTGFVAMVTAECAILGMAVEKRDTGHKALCPGSSSFIIQCVFHG